MNEMKWRDCNNQLNPSRQSHKGRKLVWFGKVFSSFNQILVLPFHVDSNHLLGFYGKKRLSLVGRLGLLVKYLNFIGLFDNKVNKRSHKHGLFINGQLRFFYRTSGITASDFIDAIKMYT